MAKTAKRQTVLIDPETKRIRDRYNDALRQGFHPDKAAKIANGEVEVAKQDETVERGFVPPEMIEAKPDLDEMPFPQLREMAEAHSPGTHIRSRKQAIDILSG